MKPFLPVQVHAAVLVLSAGIFFLDLCTPLGSVEWILYLLPLLAASRLPSSGAPLIAAAACTALTVAGFFLSPPGVPAALAIANRALGAGVLWTVALLLGRRRRAEAALQASRARLAFLMNTTPVVLYTARPSGDFAATFISENAAGLTGYEPREFTGDPGFWAGRLHPGDAARVLEEFGRLGERGELVTEYRFRFKDGSYRWMRDGARLVRDEQGAPTEIVGYWLEVTAQKQAEAALRKSEERLRLVLDGLGPQMFVGLLDLQGTVLVANQPALEAAGLRKEDVLGQPVHTTYWFTHSDEVAQRFRAAIQRAAQGETVAYDEQIRVAEGRLIWVAFTVNPLRDESGKVVFLVPSAVVIDERKRAEAALQESHARLKKVLEVETVGVMFWDLTTGCLVDANDAFLNVMGYSRADVEARELTWQRLTPPEYVEASLAEIRKFQASGRVGPYEKEYLRKDGTRNWFVFAGSSLGANACVEFCVDISDRKKAEAALGETQRQLTALIANLPGAVYRCRNDLKWTTEFVSEGVLQLSGYPAADFLEHRREIGQLIHPHDRGRVWEVIQAALRERRRWEVTYRIITASGAEKWLWEQGAGVFDALGSLQALEGFCSDITARKRAEDEIRRSREELRELARSLQSAREEERQRIARELHDELGQLLTGLKLDLAWVGKRLAAPEAEPLRAKAREMSGLLDDAVLTVRRLCTELRPPVLDSLGLFEALEWQAQEFQRRTQLPCALALPASRPEFSPERATALFRIFQELLTNIARHAGATRVDAQVETGNGKLRLEVRDDGKGFPGDGEPRSGGFGILGMRERAAFLGGEISFHNPKGGGTAVILRIPLEKDGRHAAPRPDRR